MNPDVHFRDDDGTSLPMLVWRFDQPRLAISSGPFGGGLGLRSWALNATVRRGYDRGDPDRHLQAMAGAIGLVGDGTGLMTAVDVTWVTASSDSGVRAWATVGVDTPAQAAAPDQISWRDPNLDSVGTINIVVVLPVRLSDAAMVNAVATATEAKVQAMHDAGLAGTGTPTDAVCVLCPPDGQAEPYGGPRSRLGAPLARAVHSSVASGLAR